MKTNRDNLWYILGSGTFALNGTIMLLLVSRFFGITTTGEFGVSYATSQILFIFGLFGVNIFQMTDYQKKYSFREYYNAKIITSLLMIFAYIVIIFLFKIPTSRAIYTGLLAIYFLINSFAEVYQSHFFKEGFIVLSGKSLFFRSLLSSLVFAFSLFFIRNIVLAIIFMNISNIVATYFFTIIPARAITGDKSNNKNNIDKLLKDCLPIFLSTFLTTYLFNCGKYVIDYYRLIEIQGYFNIIFIPIQLINIFGSFIFKPILPAISESIFSNNIGKVNKIKYSVIIIISLMTVSFCLIGWFLGPLVIQLFFNVNVYNLKFELICVFISGGLVAVVAFYYYILVILRKQKIISFVYIFSCIFITILSFIFISLFGIIGAILSFFITNLLILLIFIYNSKIKKDAL